MLPRRAAQTNPELTQPTLAAGPIQLVSRADGASER